MTVVFGLCQWCGHEFESRRGLTGVLTIVLTLAGMTPVYCSYVAHLLVSETKFTTRRKVLKAGGDGGGKKTKCI